LREAASALPAAPGVYTFHGDAAHMPLYIGKSVNLRSRVLAHLRAPDEARMMGQTRRISHTRTAGDLGAQLLEAQLIKQQQPLFNQRLRRNRQLCAWQLTDGMPRLAHANAVNFATTPHLYGLYASRHAAREGLMALADQHGLCHGALGLEKLPPGKPCFRHMVKRCAGACCGTEAMDAHVARLLGALQNLQVACWPHPGAVAVQETCPLDPAFHQFHVVRNWCYLGSTPTLTKARRLDRVAAAFDADGYKILCKPLLQGTATVVPLA
jgi:excinuclease Cho